MKRFLVIAVLCNVVCYALVTAADWNAEHGHASDFPWEELCTLVFILLLLAEFIAKVKRLDRDVDLKQRFCRLFLWCVIAGLFYLCYGYPALKGYWIKQRSGVMMNGVEYVIPALVIGSFMPCLYMCLWVIEALWLRFREPRQ